MCYYRLFVFLGCGHSTFSSTPVSYCANARRQSAAVNKKSSKLPEDEVSPRHSTTPSQTSTVYSSLDHGLQSETADGTASTSTVPAQATGKDIQEGNASSATAPTMEDNMQPCPEGRAHPFHTVRIERICAVCEYERDERLRALESSSSEIRFEPWRWRWKYRGGKDGPAWKHPGEGNGAGSNQRQDVRVSVRGMSAAVGSWIKDWNRKDSGMG